MNKTFNDTFLFIPDISGFSRFVNQTAIDHSRHIISELLELVIDADELGLTVSEIEGDAVLFFKDTIPTVNDVLSQVEKTFLRFHNHLRRYETERICRCGACETANSLSLKFIVHKGPVQLIKIKDHHKLHGPDVLQAHQLLKSAVGSHEYVLFTEPFSGELNALQIPAAEFRWLDKIESGTESNGSGSWTNYRYIQLSPLFKWVEKPGEMVLPDSSPGALKLEVVVNQNADTLYEIFSDLDQRNEWASNIQDIIKPGGEINQAGSVHTCVIDHKPMKIHALGRKEDDTKIVYAERINGQGVFREIIRIYTFEKHHDHTHVTLELNFRLKSTLFKAFRPWIKSRLAKQSMANLTQLKKYSEEGSG
jgi:hypothetical protein